MQDHEHPQMTRRHHSRYLFTHKHHGGHGDGQWLETLAEDDEFAVFDVADGDPDPDLSDDEVQCSDGNGNLYGTLQDGPDSLRRLGRYGEQIAKFWRQPEGMPWHGFPVWPINHEGPGNRRRHPPPKEVFDKMVQVGLITLPMPIRLKGGKHV